MPAYARDPLAEQFAPLAERAIGRLLSDAWMTHSFQVTTPARDDYDDAGGLSPYERAVQRALYYALNSTGAEGPLGGKSVQNPSWSLMRGWGPVRRDRRAFGLLSGDRHRTLWLTVVPKAEAQAAAFARRPDRLWVSNAGLQSGGIGSVKQRF